jgi:hypothetical protein
LADFRRFLRQNQQYEPKNQSQGEDLKLEPYALEQGTTGHEEIVLTEVLADFRRFLRQKPSYRTGVEGQHKEVCTFQAPGTPDCSLKESVTVYVVRKSKKNTRVEVPGMGRFLVPMNMLADFRPNSDTIRKDAKKIVRTPLKLFNLLMYEGAQIDQIALKLQVGESTAHNWVRNLKKLYREWWKVSEFIPLNSKWMALKTRKCPGCDDVHVSLPAKSQKSCQEVEIAGSLVSKVSTDPKSVPKDKHWCDECGQFAIDDVKARTNVPYPWGVIRGSHSLKERASRYAPKMRIPICGL